MAIQKSAGCKNLLAMQVKKGKKAVK